MKIGWKERDGATKERRNKKRKASGKQTRQKVRKDAKIGRRNTKQKKKRYN